ncbi:MAG: tetratricopeptide repeat protein [Deltaproteobacteria bacterium]|nr:tetratricopeptide repeat protein [Deltaproteobacteria bacterium]MBW2085297.1 tetratricopeptide repeat protein [Deltaproteobacteria bacterium]
MPDDMTAFKKVKSFLLLSLALLFLAGACGSKNEEAFLQEADAHFAKGSPDKAVQTYRDYLNEFPRGRFRDQALLRKGEILYYVLGKKGPAVQAFSRLVLDYPLSEPSFQAREILAAIYRDETADYLRAVIEYRWLLNHRPANKKADEYHYQIGHCFFLANRLEQAIMEYKLFIEGYPESRFVERAYNELGGAYMILKQPEQALSVFKTAIDRFPESSLRPTMDFKTAECYEAMDRLDEALAQYQYVREMYDNWPAVDIRIKGVESRQKSKQGRARKGNK